MNNIAARFKTDVAKHELAILRDDGLYRHLRFRSPRNEIAWFDLVTWPGALAITGDVDGYTFRRIEDMFQFFRMHRSERGGRLEINPGHWQEKVTSGREGLRAYNRDVLNEFVAAELKEAEADYPGVTAAWDKAVNDTWFPDYNLDYEEGAREALAEFEFGTKHKAACPCGESEEFDEEVDASIWRSRHRGQSSHHVSIERVQGFRFPDTSDLDLRDYAWEFLWCCHAIVWGIARYDEAKARTWKARTRRALRRLNPRRSRRAVAS